tara:strand:+ start:154 stop:1050 length:897 start_codon:yes stop_codon:yes gene_type:complete
MEHAVAVQQNPSGAVQVAPQLPAEMDVREIKRRKNLITEVMRDVMIVGQHYGKIPGTNNMSLLKPGAEMLGMAFRLSPHFSVETRELERGHREYSVQCTLTAVDGTIAAIGLGLCSTMESKYRYRYKQRTCPSCHQEAIRKSKQGSQGFYCWDKLGGCGQTFKSDEQRIISQKLGKVENEDISDQMNTVMKMGVKRAHVAAILFATGASDMFVQEEEAPPIVHDEPAAAAEPSEEAQLAVECARLFKVLDRDRDSIAELLKSNGGWAPKGSWTELTFGELKKAREILAAEVDLVGGGK